MSTTSFFETPDGLAAEFPRSVFAIVPHFRGVHPDGCGTGFIIHVGSDFAIALTAAHVIDGTRQLTPEVARASRLAFLGTAPSSDAWERQHRDLKYRALFSIQGSFHAFRITRAMISGADTAVLRLERDSDAAQSNFGELLPLNLSLHRHSWGPLLMAGVQFDRSSFECVPENHGEWTRFRARLLLRQGELVGGVDPSQSSSLAKGITFLTTIPIDHGMSGSPVFHVITHEDQRVPVVCGIASADWSVGDGSSESSSKDSLCASIFNVLPQYIEQDATVLDWLRAEKIYASGVNPKQIWFDGAALKFGNPP